VSAWRSELSGGITVPAMLDALGSSQGPKDSSYCSGNTQFEVRCIWRRNWFSVTMPPSSNVEVKVEKALRSSCGSAPPLRDTVRAQTDKSGAGRQTGYRVEYYGLPALEPWFLKLHYILRCPPHQICIYECILQGYFSTNES
jgi:hypothetical protein